MATRSKFTADRRAVIIEAITHGASIRSAAASAGVDHATVLRWLEQGESASEGSRFAEFREQVLAAEAGVSVIAARIIAREMADEPKWAAWWLERRDPAFAPPMAKREAAAATVQVAVFRIGTDGRQAPRLPSSEIEVGYVSDRPTAS